MISADKKWKFECACVILETKQNNDSEIYKLVTSVFLNYSLIIVFETLFCMRICLLLLIWVSNFKHENFVELCVVICVLVLSYV